MNSPNHVFFPAQLANSPHVVNPAAMQVPGTDSFGFPTTQPSHPQYQPHLMMWPIIPQQHPSNMPLLDRPAGFVNPYPPGHPSYPATAAGSSHQHTSPVPSTSQVHHPTSSVQDHSTVDPEDISAIEDKRRRNTAASARFRIKKKQKNMHLERAVSDLTSRAEELEKEATNLRRENSWLKKMVMMKGKRNLEDGRRSHDRASNVGNDETSEGSDVDETKKRKLKGKNRTTADGRGDSESRAQRKCGKD